MAALAVPAQADDVALSCASIKDVARDDVLWICSCYHASCDKVWFLKPDQGWIDIGTCDGRWCRVYDADGHVQGWSHRRYLEVHWECQDVRDEVMECMMLGCR